MNSSLGTVTKLLKNVLLFCTIVVIYSENSFVHPFNMLAFLPSVLGFLFFWNRLKKTSFLGSQEVLLSYNKLFIHFWNELSHSLSAIPVSWLNRWLIQNFHVNWNRNIQMITLIPGGNPDFSSFPCYIPKTLWGQRSK